MYKLIVKDARTEGEQIKEFESAELAILYRDYHLVFGQWNSVIKWVEEKHLAPEQQRYIIDEKTELINGEVVRLYKLAEGMEIKLEEVTGDSVKECWKLVREKRNKMLQFTDWTQLPDTDLSTDERKEYRNYRSYLRVIPKLYNDATIMQAKVYSFEDWKKGKR
jgi:DNA-binding ferritin-like protein (Dps family)